jgi:beta-barrel assembly-enhancing protease
MRANHAAARRPAITGGRRAWVLALLPLLAGCISERREQALGDQIAGQVNSNVPLVRDRAINHYVTDLGRLIASRSDRPEITYRFYIVDTDGVNAFALPGGYIYVNRGLVERTENVSELAGVLAHEIGHVAARHGAKSLQRQMRTRSMSHFMYETLLGRGPLLSDEAVDLGGQLWMAAHSRADEEEADRLAVGYLIRSGVDPRGMLTLFDGFRREEAAMPSSPVGGWFSTHPSSAARLQATENEIEVRLKNGPGHLAMQVSSYRDFMRRLRSLPPADQADVYPMLRAATPGRPSPTGSLPLGGD